jgi:hypothetical protein
MSQKDTVLNHLKQHGHIDTMTAIKEYWITRLSEMIRLLRVEGHEIFSEHVTDGKKHWVNYRLVVR